MYRTVLLPAARRDIQEAAKWYNTQLDGLGKRVAQNVRNKVAAIKQNPFAFTIRYQDTRVAVLDIFPFLIHYFIDETEKRIVISAVLHTSRNPANAYE